MFSCFFPLLQSAMPAKPAKPANSQCMKMDQLLTSMTAPQGFLCASTGHCDGFSCAGNIGFLGVLVRFEISININFNPNSLESPTIPLRCLFTPRKLLFLNFFFFFGLLCVFLDSQNILFLCTLEELQSWAHLYDCAVNTH